MIITNHVSLPAIYTINYVMMLQNLIIIADHDLLRNDYDENDHDSDKETASEMLSQVFKEMELNQNCRNSNRDLYDSILANDEIDPLLDEKSPNHYPDTTTTFVNVSQSQQQYQPVQHQLYQKDYQVNKHQSDTIPQLINVKPPLSKPNIPPKPTSFDSKDLFGAKPFVATSGLTNILASGQEPISRHHVSDSLESTRPFSGPNFVPAIIKPPISGKPSGESMPNYSTRPGPITSTRVGEVKTESSHPILPIRPVSSAGGTSNPSKIAISLSNRIDFISKPIQPTNIKLTSLPKESLSTSLDPLSTGDNRLKPKPPVRSKVSSSKAVKHYKVEVEEVDDDVDGLLQADDQEEELSTKSSSYSKLKRPLFSPQFISNLMSDFLPLQVFHPRLPRKRINRKAKIKMEKEIKRRETNRKKQKKNSKVKVKKTKIQVLAMLAFQI